MPPYSVDHSLKVRVHVIVNKNKGAKDDQA